MRQMQSFFAVEIMLGMSKPFVFKNGPIWERGRRGALQTEALQLLSAVSRLSWCGHHSFTTPMYIITSTFNQFAVTWSSWLLSLFASTRWLSLGTAEQPRRIEIAVVGKWGRQSLANGSFEAVVGRRIGQLVVLHQHLDGHFASRGGRSGRQRVGRQHLQCIAGLEHEVVLQLLPLRLVAPVLEPFLAINQKEAISWRLLTTICLHLSYWWH